MGEREEFDFGIAMILSGSGSAHKPAHRARHLPHTRRRRGLHCGLGTPGYGERR
jgi:hypothetical protein